MKKEEKHYIQIPEVYTRKKLNELYREIPLKDTTSRLLRKYFNAAANLYGIITLRELYDIIISQNKDLITEEEFLAFAEIARHECEDYYILGKSELYLDGPSTDFMEYEVIDVVLLENDLYHKTLLGHQGKPYYIPKKNELLAYNDPYYWERTPEAATFRDFLFTIMPNKYMCNELFTEIYFARHCLDAGLQDVLDSLDEAGVEFKKDSDLETFMMVYTAFHNNVRIQYNRGHTPSEIGSMTPVEERMPKALSFGPNIRRSIADGTYDVEELRKLTLTMDFPSEEFRQSILKEIDAALAEGKSKKN